MILHLLDPAELDLSGGPFERQITLKDLETDQPLQVDPRDIRAAYKQQVQSYLADLRRGCADCDAEYHLIQTDQPYDRALISLLARRLFNG
jgi:hypothetical protein